LLEGGSKTIPDLRQGTGRQNICIIVASRRPIRDTHPNEFGWRLKLFTHWKRATRCGLAADESHSANPRANLKLNAIASPREDERHHDCRNGAER
ncbi:MAG TPA: hypothetical protein VE689_00145, partial [Candidatus Udaeobacter sp.]|nr:hypothetical protein [Candidatus Udaeobacter sp.]